MRQHIKLTEDLAEEVTVEDETYEEVRAEDLISERVDAAPRIAPGVGRALSRMPTIRRSIAPQPPPLAPALSAIRDRQDAPGRARRLFGLAQAEIVRGELDAARLNLKLAIALDPKSPAYRAELASISGETGNA